MTDDDLRFGDVSGSSGSNNDISDSLIQLVEVLIIGYVIIKIVEILFNVPIPLV